MQEKLTEKKLQGQAISEGGMGGKTDEAGGNANQGMWLGHYSRIAGIEYR